jgi:hypothetical protein
LVNLLARGGVGFFIFEALLEEAFVFVLTSSSSMIRERSIKRENSRIIAVENFFGIVRFDSCIRDFAERIMLVKSVLYTDLSILGVPRTREMCGSFVDGNSDENVGVDFFEKRIVS